MAFLNATPDNIAEQAAAIQDRLSQYATATVSNGDLTQEARQKRLAVAYLEAVAEMDKLKTGFEGNEEKTTESLTVDVFGSVSSLGADAISARDADDRAAQLDEPDEALTLLARAESNGDQVLARAIALRAFEGAQSVLGGAPLWAPVLDAYTARRPEVAAKMAELAATRRRSAEKSIGRAFIFIVPKPYELDRMSDHQIRELAEKQLALAPPKPDFFASFGNAGPTQILPQ